MGDRAGRLARVLVLGLVGTVALKWARYHWDRFTAEQRTAIETYAGPQRSETLATPDYTFQLTAA